ncbi:MAG: S1 RNA-binding domain-containing protein, partial [Bacteriovoracaceae bacterium]|nr:S1 RNA-binding domain-containing protein [Bacteriovoracaceae bacterium]
EGFPYTIRVACEVLESNGSSSMGSVCAGSLALMDAGVPLKAPVAGVAMGLIMEGSNYKILTDILGDEDHLGDMDFKLAGTTKGVTAIQMDIKIAGISEQIFKEALTEAHAGRIHILSEMSKTMTTARSEFKEGVPTIMSTKIEKEEIGGLIGPGGKNIKGLQERFKVTIEVKEDGTVNVLGADKELLKQCMADINLMMKGPEIGAIYPATIVSIKEYGAFVDIPSGISGLVHVSEISDDRIQNVEEYLTVGDNVQVQVMSVDNFGRIKFSIKAVQPVKKKT